MPLHWPGNRRDCSRQNASHTKFLDTPEFLHLNFARRRAVLDSWPVTRRGYRRFRIFLVVPSVSFAFLDCFWFHEALLLRSEIFIRYSVRLIYIFGFLRAVRYVYAILLDFFRAFSMLNLHFPIFFGSTVRVRCFRFAAAAACRLSARTDFPLACASA